MGSELNVLAEENNLSKLMPQRTILKELHILRYNKEFQRGGIHNKIVRQNLKAAAKLQLFAARAGKRSFFYGFQRVIKNNVLYVRV